MEQYINKNEVENILRNLWKEDDGHNPEHRIYYNKALQEVQCEIDTLEVIDPYKECIQYDSIKAGIQAYAETYSFNTESKLFNQLSKEQQILWRKEIEQACINGGEVGVELAKDPRYKENVETKEADLKKEYKKFISCVNGRSMFETAKHFFEFGLKVQKGE